MGKKHSYYEKIMIVHFQDFPHTMDFVSFTRIVGNLWGNPCISDMLTSVNFFSCKAFLAYVSFTSLLISSESPW